MGLDSERRIGADPAISSNENALFNLTASVSHAGKSSSMLIRFSAIFDCRNPDSRATFNIEKQSNFSSQGYPCENSTRKE